jgi:hypothetical protein
MKYATIQAAAATIYGNEATSATKLDCAKKLLAKAIKAGWRVTTRGEVIAPTQMKKATELKIGDVVCNHGARFEIVEIRNQPLLAGPNEVVANMGKWLSGHIEAGYFGPGQLWNLQGNHRATYPVEI